MKPTVINLLNVGERYLRRAGVLTHRLSSERLLEHIMRCDRIDLYLDRSFKVERELRQKYFRFLRERARRYPLQYLLKEAHFMDFSFEVSESCLIPRPETELLVEHVCEEIRRMIPSGEARLLDIGTGSGNIALSLAKYFPYAEVWATDILKETLDIAERNAARLDVKHRVKFLQSNLFEAIPDIRFECIISNPPYLSEEDIHILEGELLFEPKAALAGGPSGAELIFALAENALHFLTEGGMLAFEMGMGQARAVRERLQQIGYSDVKILADYAGIERIALAWRRESRVQVTEDR